MSTRFMQLLCFFDLPTVTGRDRRAYRTFRRFLLKQGFVMIEESVYSRMVLSGNNQRSVMELIRKNRPPKGLVMLLPVTEKQFANMDVITGSYETDVITNTDSVVVI